MPAINKESLRLGKLRHVLYGVELLERHQCKFEFVPAINKKLWHVLYGGEPLEWHQCKFEFFHG
jgi:hypothetical protein